MEKKPFISLKVRMSIGIVSMCLLISLLAILLMFRTIKDIVDKDYIDKAEQITEAVVSSLDAYDVKELTEVVVGIYNGVDKVVPSSEWGSDEWKEYIANYKSVEDLPTFSRIRDQLREYQDIFHVNCFYIMYFDPDIRHAVYVVDGAYEDACPPGVCDAYEEGFWPDKKEKVIPATITNVKRYGWLVSAGYPVIADGKVVSYLCVDISMNDINDVESKYTYATVATIIFSTLLILVFFLIYINRNIFNPVALLSHTAKNYCAENGDMVHHNFEKLTVRNNDEISDLLLSMKQMEEDMNASITALISTKEALKETEEKAITMEALAVKDSLTGVWNGLAYEDAVRKLNAEIREGFTEFGIAMIDLNDLKKINDTYGHQNGNVAIKALCSVICDVFKRSRVFRIGGDEFVVILKKKDFKNIEQRMADFNEQLESLQKNKALLPWEKVSAAIGYAKFDEDTDAYVDDVFKKADYAMYARKASMKVSRGI